MTLLSQFQLLKFRDLLKPHRVSKISNHLLKSLVDTWKLPLPSGPLWGSRRAALAWPAWWRGWHGSSLPVLLLSPSCQGPGGPQGG